MVASAARPSGLKGSEGFVISGARAAYPRPNSRASSA